MKYVIEIECVIGDYSDGKRKVDFLEYDSLKKAVERAKAEYEYRSVIKELNEEWYITIYNDFEVNLDNDDNRKAIINGDFEYIVDYDSIWHNGDFMGDILCTEYGNDYDSSFELRDNTILFNRINKAYEYLKDEMTEIYRKLYLVDFKTEKLTFIQELADYEY